MIRELRCYVIFCDRCGEASDCAGAMVDQHFGSSRTARTEAGIYGWVRDGQRDLCPNCTPIPFLPVAVDVPREVIRCEPVVTAHVDGRDVLVGQSLCARPGETASVRIEGSADYAGFCRKRTAAVFGPAEVSCRG